ncbi:hypothetical protein Mal52_31460 [Symmachiella dynata]|uniref:Uncharacterized protein n=1 Tax=Symmachiella dynata TaxID=2527995 RepID=A0A517ZQC1_9PLAN|nr:hypothetical protein Mal52_31460 [Symmachiella dynata]
MMAFTLQVGVGKMGGTGRVVLVLRVMMWQDGTYVTVLNR